MALSIQVYRKLKTTVHQRSGSPVQYVSLFTFGYLNPKLKVIINTSVSCPPHLLAGSIPEHVGVPGRRDNLTDNVSTKSQCWRLALLDPS
jgi:hypothetical protein